MWNCSVVLIALILSVVIVSGHPTDTLSYYETLDYDPSKLHTQHIRVSRGVGTNGPVTVIKGKVLLQINAFNRSFVSYLSQWRGVFAPSVKFLVDGVDTQEYNPNTFYRGELEGEVGSKVTGHILDGVFDGSIMSKHGHFHVERTHKFFESPQKFHSIIYREDDVLSHDHGHLCGVKDAILDRLRETASKAVPLDDDKTMLYGKDRHSRLKRQAFSGNKFCQVRVAADHLFLSNIGRGSVINAMTEIAFIFSMVQNIYRTTDFDGDRMNDGIEPLIASLEVLRESEPGYRFGGGSISVGDFLDLWSQEDQSMFCLAILLTYRDFSGGVLGLAWVAEPTGGNRGGICEGQVRLQAGLRYLNTAIVTFVNYGRTQPRSVSVITIAHEFGHNFGSPHDPQGSCSPGGSDGNFIMFPQATDGSQTNNNRFSLCSINSIRPVLQSKSSCFRNSPAVCGNGIREMDEQCDCGSMCDSDPCCLTNCSLVPGASCSSLEPCCEDSCRISDTSIKCMDQTECGLESFCDGEDSKCPPPLPREGRALCNDGNNICVDGVCAGSICVRENLTDCQCTGDVNNLCHVCCVDVNGTCKSSFNILGATNGMFRESGRSCNNFRGYCSNEIPPKCVVVDNERVLNDLLDLFNLDTLNAVVLWLRVYWYVPVLAIVIIAIIMILLQLTYRRRKPIKRQFRNIRQHTLRRNQTASPPTVDGGHGRGRPSGDLSQAEGERRLKQFFPTVSREILVSVMRATRSESKAVNRLLDLGYPLRKVPLPTA